MKVYKYHFTPTIALAAIIITTLVANVNAGTLTLQVEENNEFTILHDTNPWLSGGKFVQVGQYSTKDGTLVQVGTHNNTIGADKLGHYSAISIDYAKSEDPETVMFTTTFRTYEMHDLILFEQYFHKTINSKELFSSSSKTKNSNLSANTIFPAFDRKSSINMHQEDGKDLDCFSYHGIFPQVKSCTVSTYVETHQGGVPLIIYDSRNESLPMSVFSPLNMPKAFHMASDDSFFGAGIKSTVTEIPQGYKQIFMLIGSTGINQGMMAWGDQMLKYTGKPRANMYLDATHSTIGFWTDNGGYYHYSTGVDKSKTYMEVLPEVKAYHDKIGIPFKHWQFDSWFYPKDGGVGPGGGGGAVTNWTNMESVFPDDNVTGVNGMVEIQNKLQLPIVMHNRQWSTRSDYIKNLKFEWYVSKEAAVPKDPKAFFNWFFKQQEGWGLTMYEQDWMCKEYDEVEALQTNISMGDLWLEGMALGVESSNRTQQYCMPYAHDVLSASAYKAVTNARATNDYFHATNHTNWAIGSTSLFYWAIGILPFKDGFYSSTNKQIGGQTVGPELNPDRECLMATLSCAMVGPMDGINLLNKTRVMTSCRSDGTILKPDKPVSISDSCFLNDTTTTNNNDDDAAEDPGGCYVYNTYSDVKEYGRLYYYYNDDPNSMMTSNMVFNHGDDEHSGMEYIIYNWYTGEVIDLNKDATNKLSPGYEDHIYAIVSPIMGDKFAFIGERNKYVTGATIRFQSVISVNVSENEELHVEVVGMKSENVEVCIVMIANASNDEMDSHQLSCKTVTFKKDEEVVKMVFQ